jgi:prepilin peptidase CpaA
MTAAEGLAIAAVLILVVAAGFDLVRMEIPDTLSVLLLPVAIGHQIALPETDLWPGLAALAIMLTLGVLLFARDWMGGGDIKLMAAVAPLSDLWGLPTLLAAIAIAGGVLALVIMGLRTALQAAGADPVRLPAVLQRDAPLPYAVAIALGTGLWAWHTGLFPG